MKGFIFTILTQLSIILTTVYLGYTIARHEKKYRRIALLVLALTIQLIGSEYLSYKNFINSIKDVPLKGNLYSRYDFEEVNLIDIDLSHLYAVVDLGLKLFEDNKIEMAQIRFKETLEITKRLKEENSNYSENQEFKILEAYLKNNLGVIYLQLGEKELAKFNFTQSLQLNRNDKAIINLGYVLQGEDFLNLEVWEFIKLKYAIYSI